MDLTEGVGESSSPPRSYGEVAAGVGGSYDLRNEVFNKLIESRCAEAVSDPDVFREQLYAHFSRLPPSYALDVNVDKAEDVVFHQKLLARAKYPDERPAYEIRLLERLGTGSDNEDKSVNLPSTTRDSAFDFEPCSKLEDLNLDVRRAIKGIEQRHHTDNIRRRQGKKHVAVHEVIFSSVDKPKLLSQLSALLSDIGLNIREAHVFSTTDGFSLDVFVVDGWHAEDTEGLYEAMEKAIARSEGTWSGSSYSHSAGNRSSIPLEKSGDWEIDRGLLKIGDKIASGSCGDLHRGDYLGQDVAVKVLRSEQLTDTQEDEFAQEVSILREVEHRNVVQFVGACTKSPFLCIVTEYMPGGSLFDYLHKKGNIMTVPQLLKFAIDVSKGMEYLHQKNIIHRDLKTANLLMDAHNVVKVADFGIARFQNQGGVMTAETGTYRWMAPEVINHQPYDHKADVFSFAIVLWELLTTKVPYGSMTPLQAALGVRQGRRPEIPENAHPKLLELMQECWETDPDMRPSFSEITAKLETLLQEVEEKPLSVSKN